MAKNNAGDGKRASKLIEPSEAQDATRRLARQRQRTTGKSDRITMSDTFGLFTKQGTAGPRRQATNDRAPSEREQQNIEFRMQQARKATEYPKVKEVSNPLSTEFAVIEGVLLIFAQLEYPKHLKRTDAAIMHVARSLPTAHLKNRRGLENGKRIVRKALYWAYQQLEADAKRAANQQQVRQVHGAPVRVQEAERQLVAV